MKVTLIDYTGTGHSDPDYAINKLIFTKRTRLQMSPEGLSEIASWPREKKMEELAYMARTIPSSWEFVEYTFMIEGVTRAFTHQFVRTRTASYAQQTMRVLNVEGWTYGTGPSFDQFRYGQDGSVIDGSPLSWYQKEMDLIAMTYREMIREGVKEEDARGILPTNIHTNIVSQMNLRTFVEMARKRASSRTQGEYRSVLEGMKEAVLAVHPWVSIFLERTKDKVIAELESAILASGSSNQQIISMIKLLDELRKDE